MRDNSTPVVSGLVMIVYFSQILEKVEVFAGSYSSSFTSNLSLQLRSSHLLYFQFSSTLNNPGFISFLHPHKWSFRPLAFRQNMDRDAVMCCFHTSLMLSIFLEFKHDVSLANEHCSDQHFRPLINFLLCFYCNQCFLDSTKSVNLLREKEAI